MIANHKLSEAISTLGLYEFRRQLIYKERFYGTAVELVDRWYPSSKTCSCCGHIQPMPLSERVFRCEQCRQVRDRDENASFNLEHAPNDKVRRATSELTPVDKKVPSPLEGGLAGEASPRQHSASKQEANIKTSRLNNYARFK